MENITLTRDELGNLLKAFGVLVFGIGFLFMLWLTGGFETELLSGFGRSLGASLTFVGFVFYAFYKWCWKWGWLADLMGKPIVFGVWIGTLHSDFEGKENVLPIVFVIRQDYLSIHITSYTKTQEGISRVEVLIRNGRAESTLLAYVFELTQLYPGATTRTSGTGELKLQGGGTELNGTYWTNSPTCGVIKLKRVTRSTVGVSKYEDACLKWPGNFRQARI